MIIISDELIAKLEEVFPNQCPNKGTKIEDIYWQAGAASVVVWLKNFKYNLDHRGEDDGLGYD